MTKQQQTMALGGVFFVIVVVLLVVNRAILLPAPLDLAAEYAAPMRPPIPKVIDESVIKRQDFPASADMAAPIVPGEAGVDDIFGPLRP